MKKSVHKMTLPFKVFLTVAVVFCVVGIVSSQVEYSDLKNEQAKVKEKIEYYTERVDELENKLEAPFDEEYIVKVAKEKLNFCLPEEIIFYNDLEQ